MAVGSFFSLQPFYKFFYPTVFARISGMYFANDYRLIRHGTILATSRKKSSIFSMKENMSREIAMRLYKVFPPLCYIQNIHTYNLFVFCSCHCCTLPIFAIYLRTTRLTSGNGICPLISFPR